MRLLKRTRPASGKAPRRVVRPAPRRRPKPSWLRPVLRITAIGTIAVAFGSGIGWAWQSGTVDRAWSSMVTDLHTISAEQGLAINDVLVTGRVETASDALLAALEVERGMPILALDLAAVWPALEKVLHEDEALAHLHARARAATAQHASACMHG